MDPVAKSEDCATPTSGKPDTKTMHAMNAARNCLANFEVIDVSQMVPVGRVAQAFDLAGTTSKMGAPFLRVLCEGAGTTKACTAKLGAVTTMQADGHDKPMVQTASYPPLPRTQERGTLCSGAGREQHGRAGHPPKVANRSTGVGVVEEAGVDLSVHNGHN